MSNVPEVPVFPRLNISIEPQGMTVTILLGPGTAISQVIAASDMDNVVKLWRDQKRAMGSELDIIRAVQSTKN
jgi:hypothetical protein